MRRTPRASSRPAPGRTAAVPCAAPHPVPAAAPCSHVLLEVSPWGATALSFWQARVSRSHLIWVIRLASTCTDRDPPGLLPDHVRRSTEPEFGPIQPAAGNSALSTAGISALSTETGVR